jgi:hypothetical protein
LAGLSDSKEMQALCYFFANYVLEDTSISKGYLNYLPNLCTNDGGYSFLIDAVTSLGLIGLAMKKQNQNALNTAHLKYASALRELNIALMSREGALTDQVLTTVFLMGLFEVRSTSTAIFPCLIISFRRILAPRHITYARGRSISGEQ